jgi:hypothetical protein
MLVIRARSTGIRSGLLEKRGVIKLRHGATPSSAATIHPLPLLVGVNPHQKHPSLPQKDGDIHKTSAAERPLMRLNWQ